MTEQIVSVWDATTHFLTSKITSAVGAGVVAVGAEGLKKESEIGAIIDLADYVFLSLSLPTWMQLMASFWIFTLIIEKYGFFRLVKWVWGKFIARKD